MSTDYTEIADEIKTLNNIEFWIYEQNRKINFYRWLYIEETHEKIEITPDFITIYKIVEKSKELIDSNYDFSEFPADLYLRAAIRAVGFDVSNIKYTYNELLRYYVYWNTFETNKTKYLKTHLGDQATEENYKELLTAKLQILYEKLDKCSMHITHNV